MGLQSQVSRAGAWTAAVARWVAEPRLFWFATIVVVVAVGFATGEGATELEGRAVGAVLQHLGVVIVAIGIRQTRRLFGRPGFVESTRERRDWIARLP